MPAYSRVGEEFLILPIHFFRGKCILFIKEVVLFRFVKPREDGQVICLAVFLIIRVVFLQISLLLLQNQREHVHCHIGILVAEGIIPDFIVIDMMAVKGNLPAMLKDKKAEAGQIRLVLPVRIGKVVVKKLKFEI